jgi:glycerol transport system ATP-binding protein
MLGGNVAVIDEGRVLQTGLTPEVYHNPKNIRVAEVFSDPPINYLEGIVQNGTATLGHNIEIPLKWHMNALSPGKYIFGVRSNHLFLEPHNEEDAEIRATVELAEINGSETFIHIKHDTTKLVVLEVGIYSRRIGSEISIYVNPCCFFVYNEAGVLVASPSRSTIERRIK